MPAATAAAFQPLPRRATQSVRAEPELRQGLDDAHLEGAPRRAAGEDEPDPASGAEEVESWGYVRARVHWRILLTTPGRVPAGSCAPTLNRAPDLLSLADQIPGASHQRLQEPLPVLGRDQQPAATTVADLKAVERQRRRGEGVARRADRFDLGDLDPPAERAGADDQASGR